MVENKAHVAAPPVIRLRRQKSDKPTNVAAVAFALFVLLQTPTFLYTAQPPDSKPAEVPISPLEILAMWAMGNYPSLTPIAQYMLIPGQVFNQAGKQAFVCLMGRKDAEGAPLCNPGFIMDFDELLLMTDYRARVPAFEAALGTQALACMQAAAGIMLISVFYTLVTGRPVPLKFIVACMLMMTYGIYLSGITPLPSSMFLAMLYAMQHMEPPTSPPAAEAAAAAGSAGGVGQAAGGSTTSGADARAAALSASPASKRKARKAA